MCHNVELDSLSQRTTLPDRYDVPLFHREAGAAMGVNVLVTLLKPTVLRDVVEVIPSNDDGTLHLGGDNKSLQDLTPNRHIPSKGTLLIDVVPLHGSIGGLDPETHILHPTHGLDLLRTDAALTCDEDGILGLVCPFVLYRVPSPHE